jgi:hypothetical protein
MVSARHRARRPTQRQNRRVCRIHQDYHLGSARRRLCLSLYEIISEKEKKSSLIRFFRAENLAIINKLYIFAAY